MGVSTRWRSLSILALLLLTAIFVLGLGLVLTNLGLFLLCVAGALGLALGGLGALTTKGWKRAIGVGVTS